MNDALPLKLQYFFEDEGYMAGLEGKNREDCPYEPKSPPWQHWVFGCENAIGKRRKAYG